MKLCFAGGVGEHGRNCFFVQGTESCFLVDCGKMADTPEDPYPRLAAEEICRLDAVFLTHSHADHTGALPWLWERGFRGTLIAAEETLGQLPFPYSAAVALEALCPGGAGTFRKLGISWGRSGHCPGSVWYRFEEAGKAIFFSGDYTENTQVYAVDPIRGQRADVAVLDCAYGLDAAPYAAVCEALVNETKRLLDTCGLLVFPVPKYGRGPELLQLLSSSMPKLRYYGDDRFLSALDAQRRGGFWYRPIAPCVPAKPYQGERRGIVFLSDPQLRSKEAQVVTEQVLSLGGKAVMTGTTEKGSYSDNLLSQGHMELLRYPVHLNYPQYAAVAAENRFSVTIPYHSRDFSPMKQLQF